MLLIDNNNIQLTYKDSALITVYLYIDSEPYNLNENEHVYFKVIKNCIKEETIFLLECEKESATKILIEITHESALLFDKGCYVYDLYIMQGNNQYTIIHNAKFEIV